MSVEWSPDVQKWINEGRKKWNDSLEKQRKKERERFARSAPVKPLYSTLIDGNESYWEGSAISYVGGLEDKCENDSNEIQSYVNMWLMRKKNAYL